MSHINTNLKVLSINRKVLLRAKIEHLSIEISLTIQYCRCMGRLPIKMFRSKYHQVYYNWLKQQTELIPKEEQLKFSKHWIQDWMREYNVSVHKLNKRFVIKNQYYVIRKDYIQNIWTLKMYFLDTYGIDSLLLTGIECLHTGRKAQVKKWFL